jgi:hypothetical protein
MKKLGIIIIVIGLGLAIFSTFTIFTKEKVVDLGAVEISRDKPHHLNFSPLFGVAVMLVGGAVLLFYKK